MIKKFWLSIALIGGIATDRHLKRPPPQRAEFQRADTSTGRSARWHKPVSSGRTDLAVRRTSRTTVGSKQFSLHFSLFPWDPHVGPVVELLCSPSCSRQSLVFFRCALFLALFFLTQKIKFRLPGKIIIERENIRLEGIVIRPFLSIEYVKHFYNKIIFKYVYSLFSKINIIITIKCIIYRGGRLGLLR